MLSLHLPYSLLEIVFAERYKLRSVIYQLYSFDSMDKPNGTAFHFYATFIGMFKINFEPCF